MKIILKYLAILCAISLMATACMKSEQFAEEIEGEEIILSLSPSGEILQVTDEPLKADLPAGTLYVISIYNESTPYAHGVFSDPSAMSIKLGIGKKYSIQIKAVKDGVSEITHSESLYSGNGLLDNMFHYYAKDKQDDALYGNTADISGLTDQWTMDTYYGSLSVTPTASTSSLDIHLYRMMYGLNAQVIGFNPEDGAITFTQESYLPGTASFTLTPSDAEYAIIAVINTDFETVVSAISGENDYSRASTFTAVYSGEFDGEPYAKTLIDARPITFRRNRQTILTLNISHEYHSLDATLTIYAWENGNMVIDNNYFNEVIDTDVPAPEDNSNLPLEWHFWKKGVMTETWWEETEEENMYYAVLDGDPASKALFASMANERDPITTFLNSWKPLDVNYLDLYCYISNCFDSEGNAEPTNYYFTWHLKDNFIVIAKQYMGYTHSSYGPVYFSDIIGYAMAKGGFDEATAIAWATSNGYLGERAYYDGNGGFYLAQEYFVNAGSFSSSGPDTFIAEGFVRSGN